MGLLVDGVWKDDWYDTKSTGGRFRRQESAFRNWITADGSAGPGGADYFPARTARPPSSKVTIRSSKKP